MRRSAVAVALIGFVSLGQLNAQVTLSNGTTVPKNKFIVYLFGGSCNMSGRTSDPDKAADPHCWAWGTGANARDLQAWVPCVDNIFNDAAGAGPATPFLKLMASRYPGYYFGVIQFSNTQAALRESGTDNGFMGKGYAWYDRLVADANKLKSTVTLAGLFTMVGVVEAENSSDVTTEYTASFSNDWKLMAESMRTDLGLTPAQFPVIQQEQEHEGLDNIAITLPGPAQLWAQDKLIPSKVANSATVSSVGIPIALDTHHYNHAGQVTVTKRLADTIQLKHFDFWYNATSANEGMMEKNVTGGISVRQSGARALEITLPAGTHADVAIESVDGRQVRRSALSGGTHLQDVNGLPQGSYIVDVDSKGMHSRDRVVIR